MKIVSQARIGKYLGLVAIGVIAGSILWIWSEIDLAMRERRQATQIARSLTEIRLVTFEYLLYRNERTLAQWHQVSDRLTHLLTHVEFAGERQSEILAEMRARRSDSRDVFLKLTAYTLEPSTGQDADYRRRFEAQLLSRLLIYQQDSLSAAFRIADLATDRIAAKQKTVLIAIVAGLLSIALAVVGAVSRLNQIVLAPLVRLQGATNSIASGNLNVTFKSERDDEIGSLSRDFNAMTTSLRNASERREQALRELTAANRELEAFSYSVSHDLRAPLRQVDGFAEILESDIGPKLDAENRRVLKIIRDATQRMGRLIDDLLAFSKVGRRELALQPVDMKQLAQQSFDELAASERGARRLELEPLPQALGDASTLRQVWINLLSNALKFSRRRPETPVQVGGRREAGETVYFVRDEGVGFDMKYADQLFGVFQRLHGESEYEGTGVGLALVKRIVERHGGRVWVESEEDRGATFYFSLPLEAAHDRTG